LKEIVTERVAGNPLSSIPKPRWSSNEGGYSRTSTSSHSVILSPVKNFGIIRNVETKECPNPSIQEEIKFTESLHTSNIHKASTEDDIDQIMQEISTSNSKLIESMSEAEIISAREEILSTFSTLKRKDLI